MQIVMIGTGYVGLVSASCFAEWGHQVIGVDKDVNKISHIQSGVMPIHEANLDALVAKHIASGRLRFTTDLADAMRHADVVMIAVGTPTDESGHQADLRYVYAAAREIAEHLREGMLVVTKSTVPVGTTLQIRKIIQAIAKDIVFYVASNPEFLREGTAIADFMQPDRVVFGAESQEAHELLHQLYQPLAQQGIPILGMDIASSELSKYASNAFLATKIAFINEMADLADHYGANISHIAHAMGSDNRIGKLFLQPGPGFGGSCFPKDTKALLAMAEDVGAGGTITKAVIDSNEARKAQIIHKLTRLLDGDIHGKTIAVWGLTFKANTDDMRDSASLTVVPALLAAGARVQCHDPEGMSQARMLLPATVEYRDSPLAAAVQADAIVILTEWAAYRDADMQAVAKEMRQAVMLDMRNLFAPEWMEQQGFIYASVGRAAVLMGFVVELRAHLLTHGG